MFVYIAGSELSGSSSACNIDIGQKDYSTVCSELFITSVWAAALHMCEMISFRMNITFVEQFSSTDGMDWAILMNQH